MNHPDFNLIVRLCEQARLDPLTGLYSAGMLNDALKIVEWSKAIRKHCFVIVTMEIRSTCAIPEQTTLDFAIHARHLIAPRDFFFHLHGGEFLLILLDSRPPLAELRARRIIMQCGKYALRRSPKIEIIHGIASSSCGGGIPAMSAAIAMMRNNNACDAPHASSAR